VVVGNPTSTVTRAFADSFHAAEALKAVEGAQVYLYRDLDADETEAVLDTAMGQPQVIVYFAGEVIGSPDAPVLKTAGHGTNGVDVTALLQRLAESGTQTVTFLIETCAGPNQTGSFSPPIPSTMTAFIATSPLGCEGTRLTDALIDDQTGETLQDRLDQMPIIANTADFIPMAIAAPAPIIQRPSVAPDVVSILPASPDTSNSVVAVTTVAFAESVTPLNPNTNSPTTIALPAPITSGIAALPTQEGLPEPSIIVGLISSADSFDQVDPDQNPLSSSELTYDNVEARQEMRRNTPEVFIGLVQSGAFDPPDGEVSRAIQVELARMNCYRTNIDGIWGNGSRQAVDRYFVEVGSGASTREPQPELFRSIISRDDVACPTPVAAPRPAPSAPSAPRATTNPTPSTPSPATPVTPTPAAPAQPSGGGLGDVNLGGVFRG